MLDYHLRAARRRLRLGGTHIITGKITALLERLRVAACYIAYMYRACTCIYTLTRICMCNCTHSTSQCTHIHIISTYDIVRMHVCLHIRVLMHVLCVYMCICACASTCMYVYIGLCRYTCVVMYQSQIQIRVRTHIQQPEYRLARVSRVP